MIRQFWMDPSSHFSKKTLQSLGRLNYNYSSENNDISNTLPTIKFNYIASEKPITVPFNGVGYIDRFKSKKKLEKALAICWDIITIFKQVFLPLLEKKAFLFSSVSKYSTVLCTGAQTCRLDACASATPVSTSNSSLP